MSFRYPHTWDTAVPENAPCRNMRLQENRPHLPPTMSGLLICPSDQGLLNLCLTINPQLRRVTIEGHSGYLTEYFLKAPSIPSTRQSTFSPSLGVIRNPLIPIDWCFRYIGRSQQLHRRRITDLYLLTVPLERSISTPVRGVIRDMGETANLKSRPHFTQSACFSEIRPQQWRTLSCYPVFSKRPRMSLQPSGVATFRPERSLSPICLLVGCDRISLQRRIQP
jgi:hypothetical protein